MEHSSSNSRKNDGSDDCYNEVQNANNNNNSLSIATPSCSSSSSRCCNSSTTPYPYAMCSREECQEREEFGEVSIFECVDDVRTSVSLTNTTGHGHTDTKIRREPLSVVRASVPRVTDSHGRTDTPLGTRLMRRSTILMYIPIILLNFYFLVFYFIGTIRATES